MSPNKQERQRARERHHKRIARRQRARHRRQRTIALVVAGVLVISGAVVAILATGGGTGQEAGAAPAHDTAPDPAIAEDRIWNATITTSIGVIEAELDGAAAPHAVANFVQLASEGYFDGTSCHRLLPDSLLQCGDPTASGTGGPGYTFGPIENAPPDDVYPAGTVAMARVGGDGESMGSQFFLVFADVTLPSDAAGGYSVFGTFSEGLDSLAEVGAAGVGSDGVAPAVDVMIESVEIQ